MSKPKTSNAFNLLAVDPAEESSEEEEVQDSPRTAAPPKEEPVKQTRTAQKKAAKAARDEKKRLRAAAGGNSPVGTSTPESGSSPLPPAPPQLPPTPPPELVEPVLLPLPPSKPAAPTLPPAPAPTNGHVSTAAPAKPSVLEKAKPKPVAAPSVIPAPVRASASAPAPAPVSAPTLAHGHLPKPTSTPSVKSANPAPASANGASSHKPANGSARATAPAPGKVSKEGDKTKEAEKSKKLMSIFTRTLWTFIMIGGFVGCLLMGHVYMIILVMLCQMLVYREVTRLFTLTDPKTTHTERDVWSKTLNWYFFAVANYFLYGESIIYYFKHVVFAEASLLPFATNHRIISFSLYTIGFMGFVMSLQKGYLQQQFGLFCWVHMSILLVVVSSHFIVNNILEGLIWFWVPASLVICNDIFAYIWGMSIGRTPLIKLSPKKTVEGFVGAFATTIVFAIIWGTYFSRFNYMICPVHDLGVNAWSKIQCEPNSVFLWREWQIWPPVAATLTAIIPGEIKSIWYMPYQIHLFSMACFASLVAPFGGFFASGFKRAFNIKDFGHSIPGHGGMTDRMDCQFLMGVFTYVYYSNLIREQHVTVGTVLQTIVSGLTTDQQFELMRDLKHYLEGQGLLVQL